MNYDGYRWYTRTALPEGPIDTSEVYDSENKCALSSSSYMTITKAVWHKLKEWYGGEDAPIDVISHPTTGVPTPVEKKIKTIAKLRWFLLMIILFYLSVLT